VTIQPNTSGASFGSGSAQLQIKAPFPGRYNQTLSVSSGSSLAQTVISLSTKLYMKVINAFEDGGVVETILDE